jgi:acetyltransferase-like isoleucine patch superfamily enzyme
MRSLKRVALRIMLRGLKLAAIPIEAISARAYTRYYTRVLKGYGVSFTGKPRYISNDARFEDFSLVTLGDRTVISRDVILLTHDYSITTALIANDRTPPTDIAVRRSINIGNNVFIGMNTIILPGTTVGDNVIVGAGSVLRGTIEPDSIMVGNPAVKVGRLTDQPHIWIERSQGQFAQADPV